MRSSTEKGNNRNQAAALCMRYGCRPGWRKFHFTLNLLIIFSIVISGTNAVSGKTPNIRGVQIELGDGNRIYMSFEGKITGIIVNRVTNLPGESFEYITKVGNTKIYRNHSGILTRIGHADIYRDWHGKIIKIGNADVLRDKRGSITAVSGDPNVSPLFAIDSP